ncbi:glutathione S-transferase family protein [Roseovarius rhodophyticola]|uniref:Glutathione S-transferase family protein n=1 Tax=Roseovarius rhodophyticola TaxID=3080827 RepID=A0ABZ2TBC6_9RHOB|nr:glutathione S-transferase family protein [Roseovarius sp. W115]MDV2930676.1 glutathione S-transferase family protein [Roseovarius sp. W115]
MYEVFGSRGSRAIRVLWMLEEIGVPYSHVAAKPRSPEALANNPSGKVPSMRDGDVVLTDSAAILTYLADKHGAFTHPAGTPERGLQDCLLHQVLDEIDSTLWMAARHSFVLPEERRVPAVKDTLKWEYDRNIARISDRLAGPFLMGETMTVPDIVLTHCLGWADRAGFERSGDALEAYRARMEARDAFQKVVTLP